MSEELGDARLTELVFLADLDRSAGRSVDAEIRNPGPQRDMVAFLVHEGYVNDLNTNWSHDNLRNAQDPYRDLVGQSKLERQIHQERIDTLSRVLGGQQIHVQISHRGRVRLSELKQDLQKNRIRESFGILWDKRHLETDLRIALLQAGDVHPLSVTFMDMNGLKNINDGISHDAGDAAIKAYFHVVESVLGIHADAYRNGGDEVVAILPDCDQNRALKLLRVICQSLMCERIQIGNMDAPVLTVSVGLVTTVNPTTSAEQILHQADEAMYRAKDHAKGEYPRPSSIAMSDDAKVEIVPIPGEQHQK